MSLSRVLRISHLLLVLSAIFALTAFGVLLVRANMELTALRQDRIAMEKQSAAASHTLGIILLRAAVVTDQAAKLAVVEQTYWREQNRQMAKLFVTLNRSARHFDETVVSLNGVTNSSDSAISRLSDDSHAIAVAANRNLGLLASTQVKVQRSLDSLDLPSLGKNIGLISAQGVEIEKKLEVGQDHANAILADVHKKADEYVAPKTKWEKFKNFMGLFLARSLAYAVGNHL